MKDTKFTPGPWVVSRQLGTIDGELMILAGGKGETGRPYAIAGFMTFDANDEEKKESLGNITLAMAAPDMYAALKKTAAYISEEGESAGISPLLQTVLSALAKARGE